MECNYDAAKRPGARSARGTLGLAKIYRYIIREAINKEALRYDF